MWTMPCWPGVILLSGCWWIFWDVRKKSSLCQLEGNGAIFSSSYIFLSKDSSVTQELCFYSLSYYVSNDLRHSHSLFTTPKQTKNKLLYRKTKLLLFWCHNSLMSAEHFLMFLPSHFTFLKLKLFFRDPIKINLDTTLQILLLRCRTYKIQHLHLFMCLMSTGWHLRLDEIYCSRAVKFESGNVSWRLTGKQLSGPLNGLHFPSTLSTAGSNHEGIKITCGRIVSSKQQLRDPLHSSWNESLKMHLCHEDSFSFSALIDYELFSWQVGLAAPLVCLLNDVLLSFLCYWQKQLRYLGFTVSHIVLD